MNIHPLTGGLDYTHNNCEVEASSEESTKPTHNIKLNALSEIIINVITKLPFTTQRER